MSEEVASDEFCMCEVYTWEKRKSGILDSIGSGYMSCYDLKFKWIKKKKSIHNFVVSLIIISFINIWIIHIGADSYCDLKAYDTV